MLTQQMLLALPLRDEKFWLRDLTVSVSASALKTSLAVSVSRPIRSNGYQPSSNF